jgi:hypothetical protein
MARVKHAAQVIRTPNLCSAIGQSKGECVAVVEAVSEDSRLDTVHPQLRATDPVNKIWFSVPENQE